MSTRVGPGYPGSYPGRPSSYPGRHPGSKFVNPGRHPGSKFVNPGRHPGARRAYPGRHPGSKFVNPGSYPGARRAYPGRHPGVSRAYPGTDPGGGWEFGSNRYPTDATAWLTVLGQLKRVNEVPVEARPTMTPRTQVYSTRKRGSSSCSSSALKADKGPALGPLALASAARVLRGQRHQGCCHPGGERG
jgi:hypothetical protein